MRETFKYKAGEEVWFINWGSHVGVNKPVIEEGRILGMEFDSDFIDHGEIWDYGFDTDYLNVKILSKSNLRPMICDDDDIYETQQQAIEGAATSLYLKSQTMTQWAVELLSDQMDDNNKKKKKTRKKAKRAKK